LRHVLYRAAKADPNGRFHALHDKVCREDVLWRAWFAVRRNNGAPGTGNTTLADAGEYGVTRLLGKLASDLRNGGWRPLPAEERISDQGVLKLLRAMLRAGVMEDGRVRREVTGTPQGGPALPLLCNIYLHRLDRAWDAGRHGVLVRYCDDLVVMCATRQASRGRAGAAEATAGRARA
jgi:hypothetical protein